VLRHRGERAVGDRVAIATPHRGDIERIEAELLDHGYRCYAQATLGQRLIQRWHHAAAPDGVVRVIYLLPGAWGALDWTPGHSRQLRPIRGASQIVVVQACRGDIETCQRADVGIWVVTVSTLQLLPTVEAPPGVDVARVRPLGRVPPLVAPGALVAVQRGDGPRGDMTLYRAAVA
jgi:hypothetical protein